MKALIYNRWIDTLGGGEQTLGAFAQTLARTHDVDIVTHDAPDWDRFQRILGFDLSNTVTSVVVPDDPDFHRHVSAATRDYDLFVNCSYLDHVRAYAGLNIMQVFFPPAPPVPDSAVRPRPAPYDASEPRIEAIGGLYNLERDYQGVFAWTDGRARFALHRCGPEPLAVTVRVASDREHPGLPPGTAWITADGVEVHGAVTLPASGYTNLFVVVPGTAAPSTRPVFLEVHSDTFDPSVSRDDPRPALGVRITSIATAPLQHDERGAMRWPHRDGPSGLERWTDQHRFFDSLATYDLLLANSVFTQRWIAMRFGRSSELLYPPVQIERFAPSTKRNVIVSVGRFFVDGHSKKQLAMIELFRRLCDEGLSGWEYHLVGGTHHDPAAARYFESCREAAAGYPVHLHADAPLDELIRIYGESRLYWNATGYGQDPDVEPDRFEHFGMTTVEAMASGCVPLSYARAGQPEVIEAGVSGVLFETLDELADATKELIADPDRLDTMAAGALARSTTFGYDRFRRSFHRLLTDACDAYGAIDARRESA